MKHPNELNWWIDQTGSAHLHAPPKNNSVIPMATGIVYPESNSGVITSLNNKPASLSLLSQEILDVLHNQFPGTRWWIQDAAPTNPLPKHQAAS
tara:strand:- start:494384 stop:494665 length:282 start_codon:yes stop_codon:yes gene_type:complete